MKFSILTYSVSSFGAYINIRGVKEYIFILGQNSNISFGKDIFISKVAELNLFGVSLADLLLAKSPI